MALTEYKTDRAELSFSETAPRDATIVALLLLCGLYLPTSIGANVSKALYGVGFMLCPVLLACLAGGSRRLASFPYSVAIFCSIPLLILFTSFPSFSNNSLGYLAAFFSMSTLFVMNLSNVRLNTFVTRLFIAVNIVNFIIGLGILAHIDAIDNLLTSAYSQFYPELVPGMLAWRKPVLTFGTHSLAGFFLYFFFYLNFLTYKLRQKKIFLVLAFCNLGLTLALFSVTGLVLALVGFIQVFWFFWSSFRFRWILLTGGVALAILVISLSSQWVAGVGQAWSDSTDTARKILTSPENGLLGRFTTSGTMYSGLIYIKEHPFAPIGTAGAEDVGIADSGFVDYWLRGSFLLELWAYGGLFLLLKRSLLNKSDFTFLFVSILAFEVGFSSLVYFRTPYLLGFFIIYLNSLRRPNVPDYSPPRLAHVPA